MLEKILKPIDWFFSRREKYIGSTLMHHWYVEEDSPFEKILTWAFVMVVVLFMVALLGSMTC